MLSPSLLVVVNLLSLSLLLPSLTQVSAFPQQARYSNSTQLSTSATLQTITVETAWLVVSNRSTRTSTIFNTDVDLSQYAPSKGLELWSCTEQTSCATPPMSPGTAIFLTVTSTSTEVAFPSGINANYVSGGPVAHTPASYLVPPSVVSSTKAAIASQGRPAPASRSTEGGAPPFSTNKAQTAVAKSAPEASSPATDPMTRKLPTVIMPMPSVFPDAQGNVITSTALAAAVPLPAQISPPLAQLPQGAQADPASIDSPAVTGSPALTVGSKTITANAKNQYVIGSQTLTPGGAITISGTLISLAPGGSHAVVAGSTQLLNPLATPAANPPRILTLSDEAITADAQGRYIIGSQTLALGSIITVSSTPISLAPGGEYALVGTRTQNLAAASYAPLTIGTQTITPNEQDQYISGTKTLAPGVVITVSSIPVSLASGGAYAVVGSSTQHLAITTPPPLIFGSQTITGNTAGQYIIDSQTLSPGSAITISGTPISLAPDEVYAVIGTSTEVLAGAITSPPTLTIGSQTVTADAQGQYIIDGQTLTPGSVITISGTRISLGADETDVVIGTSTEGLGGYIVGGFNPNGPGGSVGGNGTGNGVLGFTGDANSGKRVFWVEALLMGIGSIVVLYLY